MGLIIGKFRKKVTTLDVLEKLEKDIKVIEGYRKDTEQAHKKTVGRFILFSVLVYLFSAFLFYFYFFPATFYDRLFYIIPLIFAPVIIISVKRFLTWYYNWKLSRNQSKLKVLKDEKRKLLDKVMETETYKSAKIILEKFAPEQLRKNAVSSTSTELTPVKPLVPAVTPGTALRQRAPPTTVANRPSLFNNTPLPSRMYPSSSTTALRPVIGGTPQIPSSTNVSVASLPLPRAILPRDRSVLDKMVDYLVGDGPSNRYALICQQCFSHNGMAVREEFEYISFRCCYCYYLNPARKKRPTAPRLEIEANKSQRIKRFSSSDSDKNSELETDSDTEKSRLKDKSTALDARASDTEKTSDFDKLSDLDVKNSDGESPQPTDGDTVVEKGGASDEIPEGDIETTTEAKSQTPTQD